MNELLESKAEVVLTKPHLEFEEEINVPKGETNDKDVTPKVVPEECIENVGASHKDEEDGKEYLSLIVPEEVCEGVGLAAVKVEKDRGEGKPCDSKNAEERNANEGGEDYGINDDDSAKGDDNRSHDTNECEVVGEEGGREEESDDQPPRHQYPPPPPGYEHYPPPPGYYPYPPHYPPHPHYGYPPPPPSYYPPPPGYYQPPGHPHHHHPPPPHAAPPGERDPSTGNFIYGGPPPSATAPAKRIRMRIKTPQDIMNRKIRKNAQSRHRAARLREKVESIKAKGDGAKTEDETRIYQTFEERRTHKNNRSRERALEKKAELERITAKPESDRTPEEVETLNIAMMAKKRKNEGDRLRRERLKKMGLKVKPPGVSVCGRPRRPLSGETILPYGTPAPGMAGIPVAVDGGPLHLGMTPPGMPPVSHQYPPPISHVYPLPHQYYDGPPAMKEENHGRKKDDVAKNGAGMNNSDERPGSANMEQEVSEFLLQDPDVGGEEEHNHVDVDIDEEPDTIVC